MSYTSTIKNQVDLPVWDWMRPAPVATVAGSFIASSDKVGDRYMYYMNLAALYRYDTISDQWTQCASAPVAPIVGSLKYGAYGMYRGQVISCPSSTTLRIPGLNGRRCIGYKIRILSGTGQGQERTIIDGNDAVIYDTGVCTTASVNAVADSTKKWEFNQWVGYQCRLVHSTGLTQIRKILYSDTTSITVSDANFYGIYPWNSQPFVTAPIITAGSQTHFHIEANDITVDEPWDTNPDSTSRFGIVSGVLWLYSSAAATPFCTMQMYDILSDVWYTKSTMGSLLLAAPATDNAIEKTGEFSGTFQAGTVSSATTRSVTDSNLSYPMIYDRFGNFQIRIVDGMGMGQKRRIDGNTADTFFVNRPWDTIPDMTSVYEIYGDTNKVWVHGLVTSSTLLQYNVDEDNWVQGDYYNCGIARSLSIGLAGSDPIGVTSGTRGTGGITSVSPTPTAGGTNYSVGDILTCSTGGTLGKVMVTAIGASGAVTEIKLVSCGTGYTTGTGKSTTGGTGTLCTINILTADVVGKVVTAMNHYFNVGDSIVFKGDPLWNGTYTILGVNSLTEIEFLITAAGNATATSGHSVTTLTDADMNWITNEHVGKLCQVSAVGTAGAGQVRRITANTATQLTFQTAITAPTNGTTRYIIYDIAPFGRATQYKGVYPVDTSSLVPQVSRGNSGWATSGSTVTLVDSTKKWSYNQWLGYKVRIICGAGFGQEITITSNDATTLNFASSTAVDSTSKYEIMDTYGVVTGTVATTTLADTTKNWAVNQWAGKRLRILAGTGQGQETIISSNTATVLTFTAVTTAPIANDTVYSIMDVPARGAGVNVVWVFGNSSDETKGKYLIINRGGATNVTDVYDITSGKYSIVFAAYPQTETLTTGTMSAYDGANRIYFTKDATGRIYYVDLTTYSIEAFGQIPTAHGAALIGSRMEVVETVDGIKFLYVMQHTGTYMWRTLLW